MEILSQFSNEEWNPNGIAVYPQGLDDQWQGDPASSGVDDIGFISDLLSHFSSRYCISSTQIYASGKSNGGGFTSILACDPILSTQIAAFAPVSGAFYVAGSTEANCDPDKIVLGKCEPGRTNVPMWESHGTEDPKIPYEGGPRRTECLPSVVHWVEGWKDRDGLVGGSNKTELNGGEVHKYEFGTGETYGLVTHYLTEGLGHAWPSTLPNDDDSQGTFWNATPVIMEFFNKHTL